jgi:hypothetical protein
MNLNLLVNALPALQEAEVCFRSFVLFFGMMSGFEKIHCKKFYAYF